ncbi:MAG TPA: MFS transporter [Candidatus Binatia bacterium]|nr:MFS transporter [Candidatus Binatia bacterium]
MDRKWWLVILGCVTHAVNTGFSYFGMSAFFPSFEREFNWSRTAISGAFSLARIESGLLGPIEGYVIDRFGPRRIMYIGIVICVLGFVALSFVDSLPMLYVSIVLGIVLGSSLGYHMPISLLIAKIFHERRSLAFGIFRMGPGLSGAIVPLVGAMIVWWDWRTAAVASGCMLLAAGLPIAYLINRIAESEERDRELAMARHSGAGSVPHRSSDPQFTLTEVLRLKVFWFLSVAMALRHLVTEGVSVHFVILLVDRGWSTEAASTLLGISALIGAPARVGMGWLGDMVDKRKLVMGLLLALSVSVCAMGWVAGSLAFTMFMIIYSLAYGGLASLQEPIRADYFGTKAFATIQGVSRSITTAGTFVGPIMAGLFYDLTKSYSVAFTIFAVVSLLSAVLMFLARPPSKAGAAQS